MSRLYGGDQKLHADPGLLPPHYGTTARLIAIEDKVKGVRDWLLNF
jgi:hypothetical protein